MIGFDRARAVLDGSPGAADLRREAAVRRILDETPEALVPPLEESAPRLAELAARLGGRSTETLEHLLRVSSLSGELAGMLGLPVAEVQAARLGGLFHDIGKLWVPSDVLEKPLSLDAEETWLARGHALVGAGLLAGLVTRPVLDAVRHHHERVDGDGYPDRLDAESLPLLTRLVTVADTYDALSSGRPYRQALPHRRALDELEAVAGHQLDPALVAAQIAMLEREMGRELRAA
jgi:putative nucleotidyltransferase with HDIG domain